jgi:hypothetical protein
MQVVIGVTTAILPYGRRGYGGAIMAPEVNEIEDFPSFIIITYV